MNHSNDFSEQILTAATNLGEDEAGKGIEFSCAIGTVSIKPAQISLIN